MYIPISKVCSILGVSLSTVYRMLKQGILKELKEIIDVSMYKKFIKYRERLTSQEW